jgi:hypothetical protein
MIAWGLLLVLLLATSATAATPRGLLATIIRRTCAQERGPFLRLLNLLERETTEEVMNGPASITMMNGVTDTSENALGTIFIDQTATIGAGKFNITPMTSDPQVAYSTINGHSLTPLEGPNSIIFQQKGQPTVAARVALDLDLKQAAFGIAANYGVTSRLDVGLMLPLVYTSVTARAVRQVTDVLLPSGQFRPIRGKKVVAEGSASGFRQGDLVIRAKYWLPSLGPVDLAAVLGAQFPTGAPEYLTGTGDYWLDPTLVASLLIGRRMLIGASVGMLLDVSEVSQSRVTYGIGAGYALIPGRLGAVVEFLGQSQIASALSLEETNVLTLRSDRTVAEQPALGVLVSRNDEFDLSVGLRAPLWLAGERTLPGTDVTVPVGLLAFIAAVIPLNQEGVRPSGAFLTVGIGGTF